MMWIKRGKSVAVLVGVLALAIVSLATWFSWGHIRFNWLFEPLGKNEQGFPEYKHRQTGIVMVKLPGGTFWMGSPEDEENSRPVEHPMHEVVLNSFLISKYEVTQAVWTAVMANNPSIFKGDDFPVEAVSWKKCQTFCYKTKLKFPTEAQWEYACRAGKRGPIAGIGNLDEMAWHHANTGRGTRPVGKKKPNDFGLYDMHGNVWEWCEDIWDENFYSNPKATEVDPISISGSDLRVIRGGSWYKLIGSCRSAYRKGFDPARDAYTLGIRPVFYPLP